jgi:RecA/RadA recombinase
MKKVKKINKVTVKKTQTKAVEAEVVTDDAFFKSFVKEAKSLKVDILIPTDKNEPLLQVKSFIKMPPVIADFLGAPGIPCGLITEVFGAPDSGKSTFCNEILKQTQAQGGVPVLVLTELKYDLPRAEDMGLNVKRIIIKRPRTIEEVQEVIHDVVEIVKKAGKDKPVCIVWDSLGATPCENELNEKRGDFAADGAAAITKLLRKTQGLIRDCDIAFVMINQISTKIGVSFGKKTQAKGGFAPKFYSALRIEFAQIGRIRAKSDTKDADFCGIRTNAEIIKSHIGTPFTNAEFLVDYKGFVIGRDVERKQKPEVENEEDGREVVSGGTEDGESEED